MDPLSEVKTEMSKIVTVALPQDSILCSWSRSSNLSNSCYILFNKLFDWL